MEVLRTLSAYAESSGKYFYLIGGHAVNYYGLSRQTGDIDLVVARKDKDWWKELLIKLRYQAGQSDDYFARFRPYSLGEWPIDLMFVDDTTFSKLGAQAVCGEIGVAQVKIASARHLAILKIHALRQYLDYRFVKDYNDLLWLLRSSITGINLDELKELCSRYATDQLFSRIKTDLEQA